MSRRALAVAGVLATAVPAPGSAQTDTSFVGVDRIAAIVGNQVIPVSRLDEEVNLLRARGAQVPTDSAALATFRRDLLQELISEELLLQAAQRDTNIRVTEQEVQSATDVAVREVRSQFASELEYQRELRRSGFATPDEYRLWLTEQKRRDLLREMFMATLQERGELTPLPPTERELREAFEEFRAQQPQRPASVSFRQILISVQPDSAALRRAWLRAESLHTRLREGEDFAALAREHSDDPTTAERDGELGWVRRGMLVKEFEDVAFRIRPNVVSVPVHSPFGYHLIEVRRTTPAAVLVRHILIRPEITEVDRLEARTVAEAIKQALGEGAAFDSIARLRPDPDEETLLENVPRDRLPASYQHAMAGAASGDVLGPVELSDIAGRTKYAVLMFDEARPEGEYRFEDVRDRLRDSVAQRNAVEQLLRHLRDQTYVEVRL